LGKVGVGFVSWLIQSRGNRIKHINIEGCVSAGAAASALALSIDVAAALEKSCKLPSLVNGLKEGRDVFVVAGVAYDVNGLVVENATESQEAFKLHLDTIHIGEGAPGNCAHEENPEGLRNLFQSLSRIRCVVTLSVTSSHISNCLESHACSLFMCCSLRSLTVDGCFISPGGASALASGIVNGLCLLQHLSVQNCQLGDIGIGHLVCVWTAGVGPATLKISSNDIHDRGAMHLSRIISSGCLRALFADNNSIGHQGFALISDAICSATSRVQLLHVNNNNAGTSGAAAIFRNLSRKRPVVVQTPVIVEETFFVSSRGTKIERESADLQIEHQQSMSDEAAAVEIARLKTLEAFAASVASTATSHGSSRHAAGDVCGVDADHSVPWSWLESLEMRSNNIGQGCEEDLIQMIRENATLQVRTSPSCFQL
jgi:hypothetical protein